MSTFGIAPRVAMYGTFEEFIRDFHIGENDLIVTNEFITGMKNLETKAHVLFQERFGSGEPSDQMMDQIFAAARQLAFDRVVAIGGGTVIDVAKLLVLGGTASTIEYFEKRVPLKKEKQLVLIPTTCGTGSEVTNISIMEIKAYKTKKGLAENVLYADVTVLIPELLNSLPYQVFATSSMDALIHAAESFVAPQSSEFTELYSLKAIEMIVTGYKKIAAGGKEQLNLLMKDFLLASTYAGIAFGNTGVGAVHAMSYPLGGVYHVPHGEANQQLFTTVFRKYAKRNPEGRIKRLEKHLAVLLKTDLEKVWMDFDGLLEQVLSRKPLRQYGMKEAEIHSFADNVIENQQRLLKNNYVPLTREEMIEIYRILY